MNKKRDRPSRVGVRPPDPRKPLRSVRVEGEEVGIDESQVKVRDEITIPAARLKGGRSYGPQPEDDGPKKRNNVTLNDLKQQVIEATRVAGGVSKIRNECGLNETERYLARHLTPEGWWFLRMAMIDPRSYMNLLGKIMPKEVNLDAGGDGPLIRVVANVDESKI